VDPHPGGPRPRTGAAGAPRGVNLSSASESPADLEARRDALRKVGKSKLPGDVRGKASSRLRNLPEPPAALPLFDGRGLAGWEGATNAWRVRDGVLVGGSLAGNPRNEFLAADRPFTNFVLCLDYRLEARRASSTAASSSAASAWRSRRTR